MSRVWQYILVTIYLVVVLPIVYVYAMGSFDSVWKGLIVLFCTAPVVILTCKWDEDE